MQLTEVKSSAELLKMLMDKRIGVKINDSEKRFNVLHFWTGANGEVETVICSCGDAITTFKYDDELELSFE